MIPIIYLVICAAFALIVISGIMTLLSRQEKERFNNTLTYLATVIYAGNQELIPTNGKKWIDSWSPKHDDYLHGAILSKERKLQIASQWKEHMKLLDSLPLKTAVEGIPTSSFSNVFTASPSLPPKSFQTDFPSIGYSGFSGASANYEEKKEPPKPQKIAPKKKDSHKSLHPVTPKQLDLD